MVFRILSATDLSGFSGGWLPGSDSNGPTFRVSRPRTNIGRSMGTMREWGDHASSLAAPPGG